MDTDQLFTLALFALVISLWHIAEWLINILKEKLAMATKPNFKRNRYRIQDAKNQMAEKLGLDPADPRIEIEAGDGTVFLIEHPQFRSKETKARLKDLAEDDEEGIAEAILGDQYESFIEHDGDPSDLTFIFLQMSKDFQAVQAGRKRPTRS